MAIRVLLADDHKMMRDGLCMVLAQEPDIEVVGEADNGRETVQLTEKLQPDVVVMDISMPEMNGIEAARQIAGKYPKIKILPLSVHSDRRFVADILAAGASGYMLKSSAAEELVRAIRSVVGGKVYLSPSIAGLVAEGFVKTFSAEQGATVRDLLTSRELEILQLLVEGNSVKEIAFKLNLSVKTVESHRKNIYDKLNIDNLPDLTKYAVREGITALETLRK